MATLKIIREGWWRWIERGVRFDVTCTSTYIEDGHHRIIVDVPNAGEEADFKEALAKAAIDPLKIDLVVLTHFHPDHAGCLNIFPNAEYLSAGSRWKGSIHARWEDESLPLSDDVYVLKTPGHSGHDGSIIANTPQGIIAVAGDLWVRSPSDPRLQVVHDKVQLEASRQRLISLADFIIPGHGPMGPSSEAKWQLP
jgi:glyoxylase-like metal-dependent hydrolase (beta-lactamase superfamily II)